MIILDYNAIAIANIVVQKIEISEDMIRHMILNSVRMYNKKFRDEYGQMVIANDSTNWRRGVFPQYKASRRSGRDASPLDWNEIFRIINLVFEEIGQNLPYKTVRINGCEADDIIATLVETTQEFGKHDKVMIISADKDFIQLQKYNNVRQFSPMTKKFIEDSNPNQYLFEHILKGDASDGVPNVLSPDNTFVDSIRQSPMTQKKIAQFSVPPEDLRTVMGEEVYRNYCRNKKMIDLSQTPIELKNEVIAAYESFQAPHSSRVLNYLITKRCKLLIDSVGDFV